MEQKLIIQAIAEAKKLRKAGTLKIGDRYREMKAPKECKGISKYGDEIFGYVHCPDYFIKSDVTGMMCRFYINVNGVTMHPDELDKVTVVAGQIKIVQRETIMVKWDDGDKERYGNFDNALYYTRSYDKQTPVTMTSGGRSITRTRKEWYQVYESLKTWIPKQGEKVTTTFQQWADTQEADPQQ